MDVELITIFVGIIALCMVFITAVIVVIGLQTLKTMKRGNEFIGLAQSEISFISTKVALTLREINDLIAHFKEETLTLSDKSKLSLHELHDLISFLHDETKSLAIKASNGIAKVTIGSLAIGVLSQMLKKKSN
ncbi:MAG: hypothetical protein Q8R58_09715 [Sulfuricurvum sp.]|nr:hypothetical protein [Sulfuricurvum sp.]